MADKDRFNVQESLDSSIQVHPTEAWAGPVSLFMLMAKAGEMLPPWWCRARDHELRKVVKGSDHLSGAMFNMVAKMTAIPVRVEAKDKSIKAHVAMAERFTETLQVASQFGEGWTTFYGKFLDDLYSQDNGAFAEIIGPGDPTGPLTGPPISIAHLDSSRCTRTGNPLYPVLYEGIDGKLYKLHYSRVLFASQMPSTRLEMNDVGFCAVSRVINATQNLSDISLYKQEKLGSRPNRQLFITGGGLDPDDIQTAFQFAEGSMNNMGLARYSKTVVAGNRNIADPKLQVIDMAKVPDGFDEKESTILGMAVLAMGFGMDARELFPAMEAGATKADAIVQHMKQRGKGPGQTIEIVESKFNAKFLPPQLKLAFDYQDDAQDRQVADIRNIRAQARQRDLLATITNTRIEREKMSADGEISPEQFEYLELEDGRLVDGVSVEVLFYSDDPDYKEMLEGVGDANFEDKRNEIMTLIITSRDSDKIKKARRALAAINFRYVKPMEEQKKLEQELMMKTAGRANQPTGDNSGNGQGKSGGASDKPDDSYQGEKYGRKLGVEPTSVSNQETRASE
jgi:hypothetical protein